MSNGLLISRKISKVQWPVRTYFVRYCRMNIFILNISFCWINAVNKMVLFSPVSLLCRAYPRARCHKRHGFYPFKEKNLEFSPDFRLYENFIIIRGFFKFILRRKSRPRINLKNPRIIIIFLAIYNAWYKTSVFFPKFSRDEITIMSSL
jgi:hypothetical protein